MSDQKFYVLRGLPGSGKSTLGKIIKRGDNCFRCYHFEADQYFIDRDGVYRFDPAKLTAAHKSCYDNVAYRLGEGSSVVVSNTFTTMKELRPYFELGVKLNIMPTVIHCQNNFGSIHDVPSEAMQRMKSRFCHDISPLFDEYFPKGWAQ